MKHLFFLVLMTIVSSTVVQAQQCDDLMDPVNGTVRVNKSSTLFSAEYSCSDGFALVGHSFRYCNPIPACGNTQWLPSEAPKCEEQCKGVVKPPVNGNVTIKHTEDNVKKAEYSCDTNFTLTEGEPIQRCDLKSTPANWLPAKAPKCGVTHATLGGWINATGCLSNSIDSNGDQCGAGKQNQTRECKDGVKEKCNPNLRERTIECSLYDCPPVNCGSAANLSRALFANSCDQCIVSHGICDGRCYWNDDKCQLGVVAMQGQVADMVEPFATGGRGYLQDCIDWCNNATDCNSMNVCDGGEPGPYCYLFNKMLSGYEPVLASPSTYTYRATTEYNCTTYRKIVPGCENTIPPTCKFPSGITCTGAQAAGHCKKQWKDNPDCSLDTPGIIEDNCRIECEICSLCPDDKFQCNNRKCIRKEYNCNEIDDCGDGSDEQNCVDGSGDVSGEGSGDGYGEGSGSELDEKMVFTHEIGLDDDDDDVGRSLYNRLKNKNV